MSNITFKILFVIVALAIVITIPLKIVGTLPWILPTTPYVGPILTVVCIVVLCDIVRTYAMHRKARLEEEYSRDEDSMD